VAADETYVYWGTKDAVRRATGPGDPPVTVATATDSAYLLVVTDSRVIWQDVVDSIYVTDKAGSGQPVRVTEHARALTVASDDVDVYLADSLGHLARCKIDGSDCANGPNVVESDGTVNQLDFMDRFVVHGDFIYVASDVSISRAPK
jgi:hypothetical protein